jgi:glycosyltransferase involved in cell wall biosynthesis
MISIIIPTYKEEKYVRDAINQFKDLKFPHELVISDDKSPDNTVKIAKECGARVLEVATKHKTIAVNRNYGAKNTKGEFIAFFDCDSRVKDVNAFFSRAFDIFNKDKNVVAITGAFWVLPENETTMDRIVYTVFNIVHRLKNNVLHVGEAPGKFQMIRREAFDNVHGFNENLVTREDADMFQRLNRIGRTYCDWKLIIYHSGRRSRNMGWPRLLWLWTSEAFIVAVTKKAISKEWTASR